MRNLKPLAKITLPYDNAKDEKNCVSPFGYVLWNMAIPVGPLPFHLGRWPAQQGKLLFHPYFPFITKNTLKLGRLPPKIAVGQLWAKEMG
jgi:hypothetical protein